MITRLVLEGWRSHDFTEFTFGKGTNVLIGQMGSGKSSAISAICFALFGTFPDISSKKIKLDDVIMNKPVQKNRARVMLNFLLDGKEYCAKREIVRGKGTTISEIRIGDRLVEGPNSQRVTEKIEEILKINYDLFSRAVYTEQNKMDYFLEIPKGQRKQRIDELLQISKFENARKNTATVITRLSDRKEELERIVASAPKIELEKIEEEIAEKKGLLESKKTELAKLEREKSAAEAAYRSIADKKPLHKELDRKAEENVGRYETILGKIEKFGVISQKKEDVERKLNALRLKKEDVKRKTEERKLLEKEIEKFRGLVEKDKSLVADYRRKLGELKTDENAPEKRKERKEFIKKIANELGEIACKRGGIEEKLMEIGENIGKLEGKEKCPVCDADLSGLKREQLIEHKKKEKKRMEDELEALKKKILELDNLKKNVEADVEVLDNAMKKLEEAKWISKECEKMLNEIERNEKIVKEKENILEKIVIEKDVDEFSNEINQLEKLLEYFVLKDELEETSKNIENLKRKIKELDYDEKTERKLYEQLKNLERELAVVSKWCLNLADLIAEKEKRHEEMKKTEQEIKTHKNEMAYLEKTTQNLRILEDVFEKTQTLLRQQFSDATNLALTDIWTKLYPYKDYIDLRLSVDETGDYVLQLKRRDGIWINVEGITSGGERSMSCLALRIALSFVLTQNLSWIVLDEPTHNLDRQGIRELAKTLREHLPKIVEQIFVITHEEELEHATSGCLYKLERNKEEDEPTRVVVEDVG
jgi:DNA repair exonuclease SbcCD ATPase subunit